MTCGSSTRLTGRTPWYCFIIMMALVQLRSITAFSVHSFTKSSSRHRHHDHLAVIAHRIQQQILGSSTTLGTIRLWSSTSGSNEEEGSTEKNESAVLDNPIFHEYINENNVNDQVFSAMSKDGGVKITACTCRNLINDLMIMHTMTKTPADALGRTLICALLMSNGMQEEQTIQLTLNANGPLRGIVAISSGKGEVRGYVGSPMLGDMHLSEAVGKGMVQVVKNHPDWPNPYNGITQIRHGDVDRDIGIYLAESEQRSCALAAATKVDGILCKAGGGYLIEQLPGADQATLDKVQENLAKLVAKDGGDTLPTNLLLNGVTPLQIAEIVLDGLDMIPLQQITPKFVCKCTSDRLIRALRLLPRDDVEDILSKEDQIEARCEFCGKIYRMGPEEIRGKLETASGDPSKDSDFEKELQKKKAKAAKSDAEDDKEAP